MNEDEQKRIFKEALKEWLDEKFVALGKWSAGAFAVVLLAALTYIILWANGWHK